MDDVLEVLIHDEPPPGLEEADVESDLESAAAAGGLTDISDVNDEGEAVDEDAELVTRVQQWISDHPDVVQS